MPKVAQTVLDEFGRAVNRAKSLKGWTLDQLAAAMDPESSKSFLSDIEKGKRDIKRNTVGRLIKALDLDDAWIDRFVASEVEAEDEETKPDRDADRLLRMYEKDTSAPPTAEALLIGLAQEQAQLPFLDHMSAYNALKSILNDAADLKAQGLLPSNTGDQLSLILRRVSDLNDQGLRDAAGEALENAIQRNDAEAEALFNAALKQDRIRNRPADAAARLIANLYRSAPAGGVFNATRRLIHECREKGEAQALLFDLFVALQLAKHNYSRAKGRQHQGAALSDLGLCQRLVGERNVDNKYLNASLHSLTARLNLITRQSDPENWAVVHDNLGSALRALGKRVDSTAQLEMAFAAHTDALRVWTQTNTPMDWASAQNNLGTALLQLGEMEGSILRMEQAIAAFSCALKEHTQARVPMKWAGTQNNLGLAYRWLGAFAFDPTAFDRASAAYARCLQEHRRETVPFLWALTQWNLADLALARFDLAPDQTLLATARSRTLAAREVFAEGSDHQTARCDDLLAKIAALET